MIYKPEIHHRRSIRLQGYDYSQAGAYFLTLCTWDRECLLGEIVEGEMRLNPLGRIVEEQWNAIPKRFPTVELDEFTIIPNHLHGILTIVGAPLAGTLFAGPLIELTPVPDGAPARGAPTGGIISQTRTDGVSAMVCMAPSRVHKLPFKTVFREKPLFGSH